MSQRSKKMLLNAAAVQLEARRKWKFPLAERTLRLLTLSLPLLLQSPFKRFAY